MSEFGDFLYTLRKEKGMTQAELADALGITNKAVSKWETGESMPETSQLLPLSRIFGVSVDELLSGRRASTADSHTDYTYGYARDENAQTYSYEQSGVGAEQYASDGERLSEADFIKNHLFTRGKDDGNKPAIAKLGSAICSALVLIGVLIYIILGFVADGWHPYWVIVPCFALASGIAGIIFDVCDKNKREQKRARGENPYVGAICGIIMLVCVIVYLCLGVFKDLWHPCWIIPAAGGILCGIITPICMAFDGVKNKGGDRHDNEN